MRLGLFFRSGIFFLILSAMLINMAHADDRAEIIAIDAAKSALDGDDQRLDIVFPRTHPAGALSAQWSWGYGSSTDYFIAYFWWQDGYLWMEVEPIGSDQPFVCSSSFMINQGGILYDTVYLETVYSDSWCEDVPAPLVVRVTQWSYMTNVASFARDFVLMFDGGEHVYEIGITGGGGSVAPEPGDEPDPPPPTSSSSDDGGGCFIREVYGHP